MISKIKTLLALLTLANLITLTLSAEAILGTVIDNETGENVSQVSVFVSSLDAPGGQLVTDSVAYTDLDGVVRIEAVPPGMYKIRLFKSGYTLTELELQVKQGETAQFKFPLARLNLSAPTTAASSDDVDSKDVFELAALVVTAEDLTDSQKTFIDLRRTAVGTVDFLQASDFSKFAVSDIAGAIRKLPGINVVEGKFAVVRGLSDRFSSTLVNGLPVPSPDPLRQGVPLDLFPTSIIQNVAASKSFIPHMPGNSTGAAFELMTKQFPDAFEGYLKVGFRFNTNAQKTFLRNPARSSKDFFAMGKGDKGRFSTSLDNNSGRVNTAFLGEDVSAPLALTIGAGIGDTARLFRRKLGYSIALSYDSSAVTEKDGVFQNHYGISSASQTPPGFIGFNPNRWNEQTSVGTLYVGELEGGGLLQYTRSVYTVLIGALASVSLDLDEKGLHRIRWVGLVSQTADDDVRRLSEGFLPEGSRAQINPFGGNRSPIGAGGDDLGFYYNDSIQYEERNLSVLQLIGEHDFRDFNGLKVDWGLSYSLTSSDVPRRTESHYLRFVDAFEPNVTPGFGFETGNDAVGEMLQEIERSIDQDEIGARVDLAKDLKLLNRDSLFRWGFFYNKSDRAVRGSSQVVQANDRAANFTNFTFDTQEELSEALLALDISTTGSNSFDANADVSMDIRAGYSSLRIPVYRSLSMTFGVRAESVDMQASGIATLGGSSIGPSGASIATLLSGQRTTIDGSTLSNGEIIGFTNANEPVGRINESLLLPSISLVYDVSDFVTLRASFTHTYARPSFRELSPYFDRDAQTGDLILGNPNLQISNVKNYDFRAEYVYEDGGVLAVSYFYKTVEDPIESALLVSAGNLPEFRSYFNNPTTALVRGIELEARRSLAFLREDLSSFSLGFNYSYINAEVAVPDFFPLSYFQFQLLADGQLRRVIGPFVGNDGPVLGVDPERLPNTRRLFDQPEWLINADITYENERIGFSATLSLYAQSSVLTGVGVGSPTNSNNVVDQFTASYEEVNLSLSQRLSFLSENATLNFAITNLTDSTRRIIYDTEIAFAEEYERLSYKRGSSYRLSVDYKF